MNSGMAAIAIIISIILIGLTVLQVKGTSAGLFGATQTSFRTRRGFERVIFNATIVMAVVFLVVSLINFRLF